MKKRHRANTVVWVIVSILILLLLVLLFIKIRQRTQPKIVPEINNAEIAQPERKKEERMAEPQVPKIQRPKIKVAIVIDDMGYDEKIFKKFVTLGIPLTFSILPGGKFSAKIAKEARLLNYQVMLHLPMEPHNPARNPGNGTISSGMSREEMVQQLSKDLSAVPYVVGVNNHMGSLLTEDGAVMDVLLKEIGKKGLFFLDSKTSPASVAYQTAKRMGLRSGKRDVFLDNRPDVEYIKGQVAKVLKIAKRHGEATAIGHPRPETVAALREEIPEFEKEGIELVPVSEVLE